MCENHEQQNIDNDLKTKRRGGKRVINNSFLTINTHTKRNIVQIFIFVNQRLRHQGTIKPHLIYDPSWMLII